MRGSDGSDGGYPTNSKIAGEPEADIATLARDTAARARAATHPDVEAEDAAFEGAERTAIETEGRGELAGWAYSVQRHPRRRHDA